MLVRLKTVAGIPGKTRKRRMSYSPEPIGRGAVGATFEFPSPLVISLSLTGQSSGALIGIDLQGEARAACDRCLCRVDVPVEASAYVQAREEPDPDDEDLLVLTGAGDIDLGPVLHEMVALALPMKVVCSSDCRGLCAQCGQDLNEGTCECSTGAPDPRLAVLERLKTDLETERK